MRKFHVPYENKSPVISILLSSVCSSRLAEWLGSGIGSTPKSQSVGSSGLLEGTKEIIKGRGRTLSTSQIIHRRGLVLYFTPSTQKA
jgi:hypothetical protein